MAQGLVEQDLLVGVRKVILAADHVRDDHVDVVADHHEVVERRTVGTQESEVLGVLVLPLLGAVDPVFENRGPVALGHPEPHGERLAPRGPRVRLLLRDSAGGRVPKPRSLLVVGLLALSLEIGGGGEGSIGVARGHEFVSDPLVPLHPVAL